MRASGSPDTYSAVASVATATAATLLSSDGHRSIVCRPRSPRHRHGPGARPPRSTRRAARPAAVRRRGDCTSAAPRPGRLRTHHLAQGVRAPHGRRAAQGLASPLQRLVSEAVEGCVAPASRLEPVEHETAHAFEQRGTRRQAGRVGDHQGGVRRARRSARRSVGRRPRSRPADGRRSLRRVRRTRQGGRASSRWSWSRRS